MNENPPNREIEWKSPNPTAAAKRLAAVVQSPLLNAGRSAVELICIRPAPKWFTQEKVNPK